MLVLVTRQEKAAGIFLCEGAGVRKGERSHRPAAATRTSNVYWVPPRGPEQGWCVHVLVSWGGWNQVPRTGDLTEMYCLAVRKATCLRSRCRQDCLLLRSVRKNLFHSSWWFVGNLWHPWACPCISLISAFTFPWCAPRVSVSLCPNFLLYKDTSCIGLAPTLMTSC